MVNHSDFAARKADSDTVFINRENGDMLLRKTPPIHVKGSKHLRKTEGPQCAQN